MTKTKLQLMREKQGLNIIELALKVHEIEPYFDTFTTALKIASIEAGRAEANSDGTGRLVQTLAQALGCSVDELVEEETDGKIHR